MNLQEMASFSCNPKNTKDIGFIEFMLRIMVSLLQPKSCSTFANTRFRQCYIFVSQNSVGQVELHPREAS